uniref:CSON010637 protein n=1 Tax=Culicoides sonorensis TaxID=179676 RepID=A0A336M5Y2_CULSO
MNSTNNLSADNPSQEEQKLKLWKLWLLRRYSVCFMLGLGVLISFIMRLNLSIAIIPMTSNSTKNDLPDFDWNSSEQGIILSAIFVGQLLSQLPAGIFANRCNGARILGFSNTISSIISVLTPVIVFNFYTMVGVRILQGFFAGMFLPLQMSVIAKWSPVNERAKMTLFSNTGYYFASVVTFSLSGIISDYLGWRNVFYISGLVGLTWSLFWLIFYDETPQKDKRITEVERQYIVNSLGNQSKRGIKIPWLAIFKSVPFWSIIVAILTQSWILFALNTHMPTFFSQTMNIQTTKTGFYSSIPYLINGTVAMISGILSDRLISTRYFTTVQVRKLFTCVPAFVVTLLLVCLNFWMSPVLSIVILTLVLVCCALAQAGYYVNFVDIAPQFTGILLGIAFTIAIGLGAFSPTVIGMVVQHGTVEEWKVVFYIFAVVSFTGGLIYALTADAEVQQWANIPKDVESNTIVVKEIAKMLDDNKYQT